MVLAPAAAFMPIADERLERLRPKESRYMLANAAMGSACKSSYVTCGLWMIVRVGMR